MPTIRDGRGVLVVDPNEPRLAAGSGPVERLAEPTMVRVPDAAGPTNADYMAASRARGAQAGGFVKGATKAARRWNGQPPADPPTTPTGSTRLHKSPETRERMRLAQVVLAERRRVAKAAAATEVATPPSPPDPPPMPVSLAEMAAAVDRALTSDFKPRPIEGEDRCAFITQFAYPLTLVCDRPAGHAGDHRGRLLKSLVVIGHAAVPS